MKGKLGAILLAILLCPSFAQAEVWRGGGDTAQVGFEEERQAGELTICNLSFIQNIHDDIYRHGNVAQIYGTVSFSKINGKTLVYVLKIYGSDETPGGDRKTFSPVFAYINGPNYTSARHESLIFPCDGPSFVQVTAGITTSWVSLL